MASIKLSFAAKIAIIRVNRSFREFSESIKEKTGVYISHSTLHDYENTCNNIMPRADNLEALAKYAGVKPAWFLEELNIESKESNELLKEGVTLKDGEEIKPEYIADEFALEVAKVISKDGIILNKEEKSFLLNMIKTYIASVENEKRKGNKNKKTR